MKLDPGSGSILSTISAPCPRQPGGAAPASPRWDAMTKLLVSMVVIIVIGALLVRFQTMIAPLVLAVMLAYLLRPLAALLAAKTGLAWRPAVALVYLGLLLLLGGLLAVAGLAILEQLEGLYGAVVQIASPDLPARLQGLLSHPLQLGPILIDLTRPIQIGPFLFDPNHINWQPFYAQVLTSIQPALGQAGGAITRLATKTAETVAWMLFIVVISFYLLAGSRRLSGPISDAVPAGYADDAQRLLGALRPIWNAFMRGQIILAIVMGLANGLAMGALGVRYAVVLGLLGGLLEFIPIVGPFILGATAVAIALFQPSNWMGLSPIVYALVVLGVAILLQQLENNFLVPRILGDSLNLSPVVIMVGAVIGADLAGVAGLLLAAPILATLALFGRYIYRKLIDVDPWAADPPPARLSGGPRPRRRPMVRQRPPSPERPC